MKEYILSIASLIILITVLGLILPSGKTGRIIKSVCSVLILISIITPVLKLKNGEIDLETVFYEKEIKADESYLYKTAQMKVDYLKQNCIKILENTGIFSPEIDIEFNVNDNYGLELKNVKINIKNAVINSQKEHIDIIEEIKNEVSSGLLIDKGSITVYE